MKRYLAIVFLGLAIVASGTYVALSQTASPASEVAGGAGNSSNLQLVAQQVPGGRALSVQRFDRGGMRILSFIHSSSTVEEVGVLTEADEVDVTAITIQNGLFGNGSAKSGGVSVYFSGLGYYNVSFDGYGNSHYTFPTPMPLRQGDSLSIYIPGGNSTAWTQVYLIGTPPAAASDEITVY
jgi:hypothetical protein